MSSDPPKHPGSVLVVDDDPAVGKVLGALLAQAGLESQHVADGEQALATLAARPFEAVISDLRMPGMDGMQLLGRITSGWPDIPVIMITAHGTIPLAVEAMRAGAADFVLKPFDREEILFTVRKALAGAHSSEAADPKSAAQTRFVGGSEPMRQVQEMIRRAASGTATVLIRGETGTGKELAARAIHELGPRRQGPFIKFQCVALPEGLLESELFGYEKGAFTGAASRKPGRVELAQGGTLFLDEIGDLTPMMQVKLLRLLQDREFERLGGTATQKADVRFITATHRDLEALVQKGEFREDLFYRMNVVPIWIPALRDRQEDVEPLAHHFCSVFGAANGKPGASLDASAVQALRAQPWPGNVRQLQNFIERLVVLSDRETISAADVETELRRGAIGAGAVSSSAPGSQSGSEGLELDRQRREAEKKALALALQRAGDNRTQAARLLGVSRRTLYNKLQEHGLL